jgi:hypothetical protein
VVAAGLHHRRFRLLAGLAAGAALTGILLLAGGQHPRRSMSATGMFTNSMRPACAGMVMAGLQSEVRWCTAG